MSSDPTDPLQAAQLANRALRERVADLERQLKRSGSEVDPHRLGTALSEREALLSEAERIAHMGSWAWDIASGEVLWSDELHRILGYDPATNRASVDAYFARVHPEDLAWVQERVAAGIKSGVSEQIDFRMLRPDGSVRYVKVDGALLFDEAGNLQRAVGTVLDVTEAREAARALTRTAVLLSEAQRIGKMGSFEVPLDGQPPVWSDELFRVLDVDPDTTPALELFMQRLHEDDRARIGALVEGSLTTGHVEPSRARVVHRDGSIHHVDMMAAAIKDEQGVLRSIRGTIADVTALVRLEAQFHQSQKMDAVGQLAGGLAHDYNNLLMVIAGNAELLLERAENVELREILSAAESATALTNRLLAFTRRTSHRARAAWLTEDLREALGLVQRALGSGIVIQVEHAEEPWPVYVDNGQIQQILLNLALNARDAMPDGGSFRLTTRNQALDANDALTFGSSPGDYVVLTVTDTGSGMDEGTRARAFEPFFTTKPVGRGTGLGLAMVFGAMKQSGGFVQLRSRPGDGSTFELWFPRAVQVPPKPVGRVHTPAALRANVLLVEDNLPLGAVVQRLLEGAGCRVRVVNDPQQAVEVWHAEPADVLVTDVEMPGMSGVQLSELLRRTVPELRTLFITGHSTERLDLQVRDGRCAVVMKPFRGDELVRALLALLKRSDVPRE